MPTLAIFQLYCGVKPIEMVNLKTCWYITSRFHLP